MASYERMDFREPRVGGEVRLFEADFVRHTFAPRFHYCFSVSVVTRGDYRYCHLGRDGLAKEGSLLLVNPGEVHSGTGRDGEPFGLRSLFIGERRLYESGRDVGIVGSIRLAGPVVEDLALATRIRELIEDHESPTDSPEFAERERATLAHLVHAYGIAAAHGDVARPERRPIALARQHIERHFNVPVRLSELAQRAGLSRFHFLRIFKDEVGLTPHQYLTQVRVQRARVLLMSGRGIADVASACGFADQSHLNRQFSRLLGFTPGLFLRATCGSAPFWWEPARIPEWIASARARRSGPARS